ncbi:hypothetical protein [Actinacidiphila acididurans]|uniref:Uncharacterized protein n=1 Tax=Actinacidiphila acididurans TaxID=2784346 RepID=A0ABS2TMG5_9ACTN|nr:hypothetical protein [Actinacidiphila acididurans]MBM9504535.1 hypothetical protein [Actinacidiphila acididurans]
MGVNLHRVRGDLSGAQWGYCRYCEREVEMRAQSVLRARGGAVLFPDGYLVPHHTRTGPAYSLVLCVGSYTAPTDPPPEETEEGAADA